MASGTATTAASMATTAPSTATLPLMVGQTAGQTAGQSSTEPLVPIVVQIEAQDTPSVIQGARPVIGAEQTMQSTQVYGTLPYFSGAYTAPLPSTAPLPHAAMPAMSARPSLPRGYYGMPNPNWMISEREHALQQQLIQERQQFEAWKASQAQPQPQPPSTVGPVKVGDDVDIKRSVVTNKERSVSVKRARPEDQDQGTSKAKHARSASTSLRSPSPKRDYPRGTCTATRPSQASPKQAEHSLAPAQDLEAFKADMTSMLSDMLQASLSKFAS